MNEINLTDVAQIDLNWMEYKPVAVTKTTKVNYEFSVPNKCRSFIVGRKNCDLI